MRLGQLARIHNVSLEEVISHLKEIDPAHDDLHHNSKLDEQTAALVAQRFKSTGEINNDETIESVQQVSKAPDVADLGVTPTASTNELKPSLSDDTILEPEEKDEFIIETDRLLELLESEETSVDLSKITLIKAPKKELEGLKVVGKIDLPEPKSTEKETKETKPGSKVQHPRRQVSEQERENRRLKAKRKKNQYEASQEERRREKERKEKKAINEAHYLKKLQRAKSKPKHSKDKTPKPQTLAASKDQRPLPKTLLGKFWRWMNT